MVDVVKIKIWEKDLGALSWDKDRHYGFFEFFPEFQNNGWDVSPLLMPVKHSENKIFSFPNINEETFRGLPGLLSDVLPDDFGNQLINQWLVLNKISQSDFTPLDRLCYIGKRGMGALEFEPSRQLKFQPSTPVEIDKLVDLTQRVLREREDLKLNIKETEHLNELIKVGTSAGGQRAKAILAYNKQTNEIRSGQTQVPEGFKHYLFKFDGVEGSGLGDPKGFGRIEYAYYLMALDCGIDMMPSQLFIEHDRAHFMTQRFDRADGNQKTHLQTLCSIMHYDYKQPGRYSYEDAFNVMRRLKLPHTEAVELYRRMVLNVIARNQDDHTKNISFLMNEKGVWMLSPAYDITYSYNPTGIWTSSHQMSINGKRDLITLKDLIDVGERINYKQSKQTIEQIMDVVNNWEIYADRAGVPRAQAKLLKQAFRLDLFR